MTTTSSTTTDPVAAARESLDAHVRETVAWHFSEETGTPYWIEHAKEHSIDPASIETFDQLIATFDHFDADTVLRYIPHEKMIPRAYAGRPYNVFETGGTTGMPKQRVNWGRTFSTTTPSLPRPSVTSTSLRWQLVNDRSDRSTPPPPGDRTPRTLPGLFGLLCGPGPAGSNA